MATKVEYNSENFLKAGCKIMNCSCSHESQDTLHGKGKRLHNPFKKGFRCTVCGNEKVM